MRCKQCEKTIKHAGQTTRKRRVCGTCMYAANTISSKCPNCLNKLGLMENQ
jgi:predicted amidophosphoribosyltransferase